MNKSSQALWSLRLTIKFIVYLLLFSLAAYWPLTLNLFSLKNDALIYFLPVRYSISQSISHGYWPFWSPYINLGYPLHTDMQSGVWNPFVQIISLFGNYTLQTLAYETILYVFLSGVNMLLLLKHFRLHPSIALLFASAYMLCGFNSDSAQFLYWICGTSFLPLVFLFYYRMLIEKSWRLSILFAFCFYLFFVTAYPAQFILLCYFLLAFTLWYVFYKKDDLRFNKLLSLGRLLLISSIVFLLLSLPAILSYLSFIEIMDRGSGVSYQLAMTNPLHPLLLFSYILPLPVWRAPYVSISDPLVRNCFIGLIPFVFLIVSLFTKSNNQLLTFFKWTFIVALVFSFGHFGVLRPLTYYTLPLMNVFRHPAIVKFITNFSACFLGAFCLHQIMERQIKLKSKWAVLFIPISITVMMLVWAFMNQFYLFSISKDSTIYSFFNRIKNDFESISFADLTVLNILIQTPFLLLIYLAIIKKLRLRWLVIGGIVNCLLHAILFQPFTVVRNESATSTQSVIESAERVGFPIPDLNASVYTTQQLPPETFLKYGPLYIYGKEISHEIITMGPGRPKKQEELKQRHSLLQLTYSYPLLYRADTIMQYFDSNKAYTEKIVLTNKRPLEHFEKAVPYKAAINHFTPNQWSLEIESIKAGFYCLQHNYDPHWKLYIDGKQQEIILTNITYMGFSLPAGQHKVQFRYEATSIKFAFFLNVLLTITILAITIYWYLRKQL